MFRTMKYLLLLCILWSPCDASKRTLKAFLNPGLSECGDVCAGKKPITLYVRAEGPSDTLHYLWDLTGHPAVLLAVTSPSAKIHINWSPYLLHLPQSVNFTEKPQYTFGLEIQKIFEFNDVNDTGSMNTIRNSDIKVLDPRWFNWVQKSIINETNFIELQVNGDSYFDRLTNLTKSGNLQIALNGFSNLDHSDVLPHMLHSENSSQIDIILNKFETDPKFNSSRFGMELLFISEENTDVPMHIDATKSLDDEHTPGIFEVIELRTPSIKNHDGQQNAAAYLQWRPISYTTESRDVTDTTEIVYYPIRNVSINSNVTIFSPLYAYYGERMHDLLVKKINISLGTKGDDFYKKTNYSTWTFIVGYGTPPAERFSYLVIMIISIGVGLPALIMIITCIYLCIRRVPKQPRNLFVNS